MAEAAEPKVFDSGAKRSGETPPYHLIPPEALKRVAQRYQMGVEKYGILNYFKGINDPAFIRQLLDHMDEHLNAYKRDGSTVDDNLAGIIWGAMTLMVVEEYNPGIITECITGPRADAIKAALTMVRPAQPLNEGSKKVLAGTVPDSRPGAFAKKS